MNKRAAYKLLGFVFVTLLMCGIYRSTVWADSDSTDTTVGKQLNYTEKSIYEDKSFKLKLSKVKYKEKIVWTSSDESVATVSGGAVTGISEGEAVITAEYRGKTYECTVTVMSPTINITLKNCIPGDSFKLKISGVAGVTYSSDNKKSVYVTSKGTVKARRVGFAVITATDSKGRTYTCNVNVYDNEKNNNKYIVSHAVNEVGWPNFKPTSTKSFVVTPGVLVNYTNTLKSSGTPQGLIYLKDSNITSLMKYDQTCMLQEEIIDPLSDMLEACKAATNVGYYEMNYYGGYRTYELQNRFWNNRIDQDPTYGQTPYVEGTKVVPGSSSEHRTGYAVDILTGEKAYEWLKKNSYKYGFIKRYSGDKTAYTGVMDEYWHFTYVGTAVALVCYQENLCLEEYYEKYVWPAAELEF